MRLFCDFHIHTALSPCSDDDMSPGNIVGMAMLKGLDVIAITDHQRCGNILSTMRIAQEYGITVIPGMELETAEEIHFICLFPTLEKALSFETIVKSKMPVVKNREDIFGEEWYFNENDEKIGKEENLLLISCSITYAEAFTLVDELEGICYPAHVDRDSYSVLSAFGMIPVEYKNNILEISANCDEKQFLLSHPELSKYNLLRSSDAHALPAILEPGVMVEIAQLNEGANCISHIIKALRH